MTRTAEQLNSLSRKKGHAIEYICVIYGMHREPCVERKRNVARAANSLTCPLNCRQSYMCSRHKKARVLRRYLCAADALQMLRMQMSHVITRTSLLGTSRCVASSLYTVIAYIRLFHRYNSPLISRNMQFS